MPWVLSKGFPPQTYLILFADPAKGLLRPSGTLQSGMRIGPGHMRHTVHTRKLVFVFGNVFFITLKMFDHLFDVEIPDLDELSLSGSGIGVFQSLLGCGSNH